jgi:hypothetical protein
MVFAFETASNGRNRHDPPAWPAVYSSFTSISFLLLASVRLWQLRLSSVKIKPIRNSHIKVVCLETENERMLEDINSSSGHYIDIPGIATEYSHQILYGISGSIWYTAVLAYCFVHCCSCLLRTFCRGASPVRNTIDFVGALYSCLCLWKCI